MASTPGLGERRTFLFQPTNRERPPVRHSSTSSATSTPPASAHTPSSRSVENLHTLDLNADAFRSKYPGPFSPHSPDSARRNSKAHLKNYFFTPITPEPADVLDDTDDPMGLHRPRGESDLGRPVLRSRAPSATYGLPAVPAEIEPDTPLIRTAPTSFETKYSLPDEILTAILLPLPYLLGSLVRPFTKAIDHTKHSPRTEAAEEILEEVASAALPVTTKNSGLFDACALAAGTLIIFGIYGHLRLRQELDRRRSNSSASRDPISTTRSMLTWNYAKQLLIRVGAIGLPFLAMVEIGGVRTGLFLLAGAAEGLIAPDTRAEQIKLKSWRRTLQTHRWMAGVFLLSLLADLFLLPRDTEPASIIRGYAALVKPILLLQSPMAAASGSSPYPVRPISPLISSARESTATMISGLLLGGLTLALAYNLAQIPLFDTADLLLFAATVAAGAALLALSKPASLRSASKPGFALGLLICATSSCFSASWKHLSVLAIPTLCALSYLAVQMDTKTIRSTSTSLHTHHNHQHHQKPVMSGSAFTQFLLRRTTEWPLLHSILSEKESRHITYFMFINLSFMFVQTFYSILSGSLGLLSDSIHMLFDCVGLLAGLIAAVMSKWPPSQKFPYGYGKVEVLSGLGNGIFLMFISVEIIWESIERVMEGAELKHMNELLLVSVAGLLVNVLGLQLCGHHHHHGHDHSHGHSHAHDEHESSGVNGHVDGAAMNGTSLTGAEKLAEHSHSHAGHHHHDHANENMAGIYLHILADTMGSVAVIVSTLLTQYTGWYGWDPLASFVIAVLIIAASYPLVVGSAKQLLLTLPAEMEYTVRSTLQGISEIRGVSGYAVPRFWLDEGQIKETDSHEGHDHSHVDHDHVHKNHSDEKQTHAHSHENTRSPSHKHSHSHSKSRKNCDSSDHDHSHHTHEHNHQHAHDHKTHDHDHDHSHSHSTSISHSGPKLLGVIHVIASPRSNMEDVRKRVHTFLQERNMDVLVHVEREGQSKCWCGGTGQSGHHRMRSTVAMGNDVTRF